MLVKLLKHEFHQTGRLFLWLLSIGIIGGGIGALITLNQDIGAGQFLIAFIWNTLLVLGASVMQVIGVVMLIVSTNRSLFTERGYLTFALPVSSTELLFSKFAANVIFMLLNIAEAALLFYIAGQNIARLISRLGEDIAERMGMGDIQEQFGDLAEMPTVGEFVTFGLYLLAIILVFLVLSMMIVLFTLTISHVRPFQARPGLWILVFLVASSVFSYYVVRILTDIGPRFLVPLNFGGALMTGDSPTLNVFVGVVMLGLSVGFFFLTDWMLRKKISLK